MAPPRSVAPPPSLTLRRATPADVDEILALVHELAEFERAPEAVTATRDDYLRDGFGEHPLFHVLIVEIEGNIAGFAFYFRKYSTWTGKPTLHLEDILVRARYRKAGVATTLMAALAREALDTGCARFDWHVLDWNVGAIEFYERRGAVVQREWLPVRLEGAALKALAALALSGDAAVTRR